MNTLLILIISIPLIEIYLFIKIGSQIGAFNTIYARYEGFNTLKSGISQLMKNELPFYEIISGAALAFASLLLILPGFATDIIGFLLIFPPTRKLLLKKVSNKYSRKNNKKEDFINGEFVDIEEDKIEDNKDEKL